MSAFKIQDYRQLSGNTLKLIAAVAMLIDHVGYILLPQYRILRYIGRLAFPVFAFMIAEGCHYTKNRLRYFLTIFLLGAAWQGARLLLFRDSYMNILLTFSCSLLLIYLLQEWKARNKIWMLFPFAGAVGACYLLTRYVSLDYGFWGILVPVLTSLVFPARGSKIDDECRNLSLVMFGTGLSVLAVYAGGSQYFSLLALPLMCFYSGQRGKRNFKYAFYLFYPLHLIVLELLARLIP